jgi:UDP-glucose 4-epimerase
MNVLVTGAAGYVGSVCAEVLVRQGHRVIALDDLSQGHRAAIPASCDFQRCDIFDTDCLDRVFRASGIHAVMHFAGEILVEKSAREPSTFYRANVAGGILLLDAMIRHGVNKMVFSSSAAVYGEPRQVPIPENHPTVPINPYGQTKLLFENILTDYARYAGLRHISLRYFNAAGASQERGEAHRTETHIIPKILDAATGAIPHFEVRGTDYSTPDGTCVRDYVHVLDIAEAHVLALANIESVSGEAFNVGSNRGYSIREVVETARRVTGLSIPAIDAPRRPGDPAVLVADAAKLRHTLCWEPRYSTLEAILTAAWAWKQRHPRGYPDMNGATER